MTGGGYVPSPLDWVRAEVEHYERTGSGLSDRPLVLLTTRGARTGALRKTPLMRVTAGGTWAAIASAAGHCDHPAWYFNVLADPRVQLQDGPDLWDLTAREVTGPERSAWWSRANAVFPSYADYQRSTRRRIPVLLLEA